MIAVLSLALNGVLSNASVRSSHPLPAFRSPPWRARHRRKRRRLASEVATLLRHGRARLSGGPPVERTGISGSPARRAPAFLGHSRGVGLHHAIRLGLDAVRPAVHARRGGQRSGVRVRVLPELRLALGGRSLGLRGRSRAALRARAGAFRVVRAAVVQAAPAGASRCPRWSRAPCA